MNPAVQKTGKVPVVIDVSVPARHITVTFAA
jgi:hypothetical protein